MKKIIIGLSAVLLISIVFSGCIINGFNCIHGTGEIVEETLALSDFSGIEIKGSFDVVITQGDEQEVIAKGHQNIIDMLERNVSGGFWDIEFENHECFNDYELTIYITVPNLDAVYISGSGDVEVGSFVNQENLDLKISGSGDIDIDDFTGLTEAGVKITGSGNVALKGTTEVLDIKITGSGEYNGFDMISEDCTVKIAGSGDCEVYAENSLFVEITGSGSVYYKGNPELSVSITGSGSVISRN